MNTLAAVRGFVGQLADMDDQVRLCRPILSFGTDDSSLFLARRLEWGDGERRVKHVERAELWRFGMALDPTQRLTIRSGAGVAVMGKEFVHNVLAANLMAVRPLAFRPAHGLDCRIAIAKPGEFNAFVTDLVRRAQMVFDRELSSPDGPDALSAAGSGALYVLKQAPLRWSIDVALRVLAGLRLQPHADERTLDLQAYFATFLKTEESSLDRQVSDYIAKCHSDKAAAKKLGLLAAHYQRFRERWTSYEEVTKVHLYREKPDFLLPASNRCPHADQDYWLPPQKPVAHT